LGVSKQVLHRRVAVVVALAVLCFHSAADASPQRPGQEDPSESESAGGAVDLNVDVGSADPADVVAAADQIAENLSTNLQRFEDAEAAIDVAVLALAEADGAISNTELRIEELVIQSDQIIVEAFVTPPSFDVIDSLTMENATEAAIKQGVLDIQADRDAHVLTQLQDQRDELEGQRREQRQARDDAEAARLDAEDALADLEGAVDQQTQFVRAVEARLEEESNAAEELAESDPTLAEQIDSTRSELQEALAAIQIERAAELAAQREREERERQIRENGFLCPIDPVGATNFGDTWGAARSGGRSHQGTDMMAATGTHTVAPESGRVVHRGTSLGGMSWYLYSDDGDMYYGTHLSAYENTGAGHVEAGTLIGYVGSSGNASATAPHLHFEYHPGGGSAINPYPYLVNACPGSAG
jgi:peptidoglycan LD-endopeptidase LytH